MTKRWLTVLVFNGKISYWDQKASLLCSHNLIRVLSSFMYWVVQYHTHLSQHRERNFLGPFSQSILLRLQHPSTIDMYMYVVLSLLTGCKSGKSNASMRKAMSVLYIVHRKRNLIALKQLIVCGEQFSILAYKSVHMFPLKFLLDKVTKKGAVRILVGNL
jgi:hypothetical protein